MAEGWLKRTDMFRAALRKESVPLDELWEIFVVLNSQEGSKFNLAQITNELFREIARKDPNAGLKRLGSLGAGVIRREALMGYGSRVPAALVPELVKMLRESGYPEDMRDLGGGISGATSLYTVAELKTLLDLRLFNESTQLSFLSEYNSKTSTALGPAMPVDSGRVPEGLQPLPELGPTEPETPKPQSMVVLNQELSKDPVTAANGLQRGIYGAEVVTPKIVENVASLLTAQNPSKALAWAAKWDDDGLKKAAISEVVWSWSRSDPAQCMEFVAGMKKGKAKDLATTEFMRYLVAKGNHEEAAQQVLTISDSQVRHEAENLLK